MDDEPTGSIDTDLTISVGGSITGTIEAEGDIDFVAVVLVAGTTYQIDMEGSRTGQGTLGDPFITGIFAANGTSIVGSDDDGGVRANSRISFTPEVSGTYYIGLSHFDNVSFDDVGTYRLFVEVEALSLRPDPVDVELSGLPGVDHVDPIVAGIRYTPDSDGVTRVTYSVPGENAEYLIPFEVDDVDIIPNFRPADASTVQYFTDALTYVGEVANIEFTEVLDSGTQFGVIRIAATTAVSGNTVGVAGLPGELLTDGDIFIFEDRLNSASITEYVVIHEIGHTLGLTHPDEGNIVADLQFQGIEYTAMASSLTSSFHPDATNSNLFPSTFGYLDILALRYLYGEDVNAFSGNDTYVFDLSDRHFMTIFDLGGTDTIQITNGSTDVVVDLTPNPDTLNGAFINVGTTVTYFDENGTVGQSQNTVYITPETVIENITSASGDDLLVGNSVANRLAGGSGNDTLRGAGGNDRLLGENGTDLLEGGAGDDFISGGSGDDAASGQAGNDQIFAGSGDTGADIFIGGAGNDVLGGGAGDDLLVGGGFSDGDAAHVGLAGDETGDDGADTLYGADGNDTVLGGGWDDALIADNGLFDRGEEITSGSADNILWAGLGDDLVYGAGGADRIGGRDGADTLYGGAGDDTIYGGASNDSDYIDGGDGDDILFSGAGDDSVVGGAGNDVFYDAAGADVYSGGTGADVYYFASGGGDDAITDFAVGTDTVSFENSTASFSVASDVFDAANVTSQNGASGVLIDTGGGDSLFLEGLVKTDLLSVDYIF